jgi:hypothetical protein
MTTPLQTRAAPRAPWLSPLANRNFRLLWVGESVSLFGDQFYLIALPWLAFQMTGSALAFGTLLLAAGIPRAVFMLVGGVMTDRFSPRLIMIASNLLRLLLTVLLTLIVAAQVVQLWMLYAIAFCFGTADAFFHPAYRSIVPVIVVANDLQPANSLMESTSQLVQIIGPGLAGMMVTAVGAGLAFALDALTFLFSAVLLWKMHPIQQPSTALQPVEAAEPAVTRPASVRAEIAEMLAYIRHDRLLTTLIVVVAAINLLFVGPLIVGSAALSQSRFEQGPAAYGAMLSAFAIGALAGTLVAGAVHLKQPGIVSLLLVALEGVVMVGIGLSAWLALTCLLWALAGFGAGFGSLNLITITQTRVARPMLGRYMSLMGLTEVGLTPISNALAGLLADWNVTLLFIGAGVCLSIVALWAATNRELRL